MKKKNENIEQLFDKEFDDFINGEINEEYSPTQEVKDRIKEKAMKNVEKRKSEENKKDFAIINDIREEKMKRKTNKKFRKIAAMVASLVIVVGIGSVITIGKDFMTTVKEVKSGRLTISEEHLDVDPSEIQVRLPKELRGKVFNKDGKEVTVLNGSMKELYDEKGNKITTLPIDGEGNYVPKTKEPEFVRFTDPKEAAKHANFPIRYIPSMNIDRIEFMKDDNGEVVKDYADVYQSKDGQHIVIFQRRGAKELAYSTGGSKVEKVKVLGKDAILFNSKEVTLDNGDAFISVSGKLSDYKDDSLVKLANTLVEIKK